jgi:hypothetical protein
VLDQAVKQGLNATLVSREFEVVKVDVGRFNLQSQLGHRSATGSLALISGLPRYALLRPARGQLLAPVCRCAPTEKSDGRTVRNSI